MTDKAFMTCLWFDAITDSGPGKAQRATEAVFTMKKFDIAALRRAYAGG